MILVTLVMALGCALSAVAAGTFGSPVAMWFFGLLSGVWCGWSVVQWRQR